MINKKSWLFLRGLTRGEKHWADFPQHVQKLIPEDQIFFVELPGNGEDFLGKSPTSIPAFVDAIRPQALRKKLYEELNVIAISMGAMITVDWMRRFPGEIHHAFLINTSAGNFSLPYERFQIGNVLKFALDYTFTNKESNIMRMSSNHLERAKAIQPGLDAYSASHPVAAANALKQIFAAGTYAFPSQPPGKLSLFVSEKDRLVKSACSKEIAQKWNLPLQVHPTAGHDLPLDDPQWLAEKIMQAYNSDMIASK